LQHKYENKLGVAKYKALQIKQIIAKSTEL
jgi:hypothetical protein